MHLDEETLQRLLDGELEPSAESAAHLHLTECDACRELLARATQDEEETHALLQLADHPPPQVSAETIAARARARPQAWSHRRAASILVALGVAGAVYAAPGSPLPKWVANAMDWIRNRPGTESAIPTPEAPSMPDMDSKTSGIAIAPGERLVIVFTSPQTEGGVRVSLTEDADVVVRGPSGSAHFTSEPERLVIDNASSTAIFDVAIPRGAPRVEIQVGDHSIFLKEGSRVTPKEIGESWTLPLSLGTP